MTSYVERSAQFCLLAMQLFLGWDILPVSNIVYHYLYRRSLWKQIVSDVLHPYIKD